jgi:hypothetical protein
VFPFAMSVAVLTVGVCKAWAGVQAAFVCLKLIVPECVLGPIIVPVAHESVPSECSPEFPYRVHTIRRAEGRISKQKQHGTMARPLYPLRSESGISSGVMPKLNIDGYSVFCSGSWLLTQRSRVRFPGLPDFFLSRSGSRTGSTQPL